MADGLLFSKLQPFKLDTSFLNIMERNRARVLQSQQNEANKMEEERANLFKGFGKLKSEGDYLRASVDVVNKAKSQKVDLYNQYRSGKVSQQDYIIKSAQIDSVPDRMNALYQMADGKIKELSEGDEKLNASNLNKLMFGLKDVEVDYVDDEIRVTYNTEEGKKTEAAEEFMSKLTSIQSVPQLGDVNEVALKYGTAFKADLVQQARTLSSQTDQGIDVGDSRAKFDDGFRSIFGNKDDGNNPRVLKATTDDIPYEDAYDFLYDSARSQVATIHRESKKIPPKPTSTGSDVDKDLKKSNLTVLTKSGAGKDTITKINYSLPNGNGDTREIKGIGASFSAADSKSRFELPYNTLEGIEEGDTRRFLATQFFIDEDTEELYVKGIAAPKDILLGGTSLSEIAEVGKKTGYIKFSADDYSKFRSQVLAGRTGAEIVEFLKGKAPATEKTSGAFDDI